MAKRKKTWQEELFDLVVSLSLVGALFLTMFVFLKTSSFLWAGAAFGGVVGVMFAFRMLFLLHERDQMKRAGIHQIDQMTGKQFEQYLQLLFQRKGYRVQMTPDTGDFGADLVMEKDSVRIVVQAKRHKQNVGITAVQEVIGAKAHYKAQLAWVICNSFFTDAAVSLAKSNNVTLFDRKNLIDLILNN
jgi:restriction system protein